MPFQVKFSRCLLVNMLILMEFTEALRGNCSLDAAVTYTWSNVMYLLKGINTSDGRMMILLVWLRVCLISLIFSSFFLIFSLSWDIRTYSAVVIKYLESLCFSLTYCMCICMCVCVCVCVCVWCVYVCRTVQGWWWWC